MKLLKIFLLGISCFLLSSGAHAQDFKKKQMEQVRAINNVYKKKRVTELEYQKLMHEQDIITAAIDKAKADDYFSPKEKNNIYAKQKRAAKRLAKYQRNGEVY